MEDSVTLDVEDNPFHPFEETGRYRAFEEGWGAWHQRRSLAASPYALSESGEALAWLDGWTAAEKQGGARRREEA